MHINYCREFIKLTTITDYVIVLPIADVNSVSVCKLGIRTTEFPSHADRYESEDKKATCVIYDDSSYIFVKETPEQIFDMLALSGH